MENPDGRPGLNLARLRLLALRLGFRLPKEMDNRLFYRLFFRRAGRFGVGLVGFTKTIRGQHTWTLKRRFCICATRSAGHTVQMNDPEAESKNAPQEEKIPAWLK